MVPDLAVLALDHQALQVIGLATHAIERVAVGREDEVERAELDGRILEEGAARLEPCVARRRPLAQLVDARREQVNLAVLLDALLDVFEGRLRAPQAVRLRKPILSLL